MKTIFTSEEELVTCISSFVRSNPNPLLKTGSFSLVTELNLGYGIADIVAVSYKDETPSERKNFLAYFDVSLLNLIEKRNRISFDDIVYITRSPEKKILSSLSSLMEEGFVSLRKGYYSSHKKYADILTDSIAIEAKLKDWRRALKQAYRYKWFSNKSFVFLPIENIKVPKKNITLFEKYNVGLAGVSKNKGIEVIFSPKEEPPISYNMRIALNEHLLFRQGPSSRHL